MLSTRLKSLRKEKGIKQRELAEAVQLSTSAIAMYETDNRDPDTGTLQKLADYFDVSLDYLLGRSDEKGMYGTVNAEGIINENSPEYVNKGNNRWKINLFDEILQTMSKEGILGDDFEIDEENELVILKRFQKLVRMYQLMWVDED